MIEFVYQANILVYELDNELLLGNYEHIHQNSLCISPFIRQYFPGL